MYRALYLETTLDHYHNSLRKESQFLLYPFEQKGNQVCRSEELRLRSLGVSRAPSTARHCLCSTGWRQKQRTSGLALPTLLSLLILGKTLLSPASVPLCPLGRRKRSAGYFSSFSRSPGDRLYQEWYICSTDGPGGRYSKQNKPDTKRRIFYDSTNMKYLRVVKIIEAESRMVISKGWLVGLGEETYRLMDIEFQFYEKEKVWR